MFDKALGACFQRHTSCCGECNEGSDKSRPRVEETVSSKRGVGSVRGCRGVAPLCKVRTVEETPVVAREQSQRLAFWHRVAYKAGKAVGTHCSVKSHRAFDRSRTVRTVKGQKHGHVGTGTTDATDEVKVAPGAARQAGSSRKMAAAPRKAAAERQEAAAARQEKRCRQEARQHRRGGWKQPQHGRAWQEAAAAAGARQRAAAVARHPRGGWRQQYRQEAADEAKNQVRWARRRSRVPGTQAMAQGTAGLEKSTRKAAKREEGKRGQLGVQAILIRCWWPKVPFMFPEELDQRRNLGMGSFIGGQAVHPYSEVCVRGLWQVPLDGEITVPEIVKAASLLTADAAIAVDEAKVGKLCRERTMPAEKDDQQAAREWHHLQCPKYKAEEVPALCGSLPAVLPCQKELLLTDLLG